MIRNSYRIMIEDLKRKGLMDGLKDEFGDDVYKNFINLINDSSFHVKTRNAMLMILTPRQLHVDDKSQAAFLRAAVSRLANETIIDREGVFYLEKVTQLVSDDYSGLGLKDFPVNVTYRTYFNNHHPDYSTGSFPLNDEAVAKNLCPVAAIDVSTIEMPDGQNRQGTHAMVLDSIENGHFVFKNTYVRNKQVRISVEKGPLEFFYVHLELNKEGLNQLRQRRKQLETQT